MILKNFLIHLKITYPQMNSQSTDIPIFKMPETIPPKIIPTQPEKNMLSPNTSEDKKVSNQDDLTQELFNYIAEEAKASVASTTGTSEISKSSKPVIIELKTSKPLKSIEHRNFL